MPVMALCLAFLELLLFFYKLGVLGGHEFVVTGLGVFVVEEHRPEEMELARDERGDDEERRKDRDAGHDGYLGHEEGSEAEQRGPRIHDEDCLALVEALGDEAVVDVAAVSLADADMGALAADDGRERVDDGDARDHERNDDGGEAGDARNREHGHDTERIAEQEGAGVPEEYARRIEVVA